MTATALTTMEASALARHEDTIQRGWSQFIEVGRALKKIRDGRLYRAEHGTFDDYCRVRWHWARDYVNKQIAAADVVADLDTMVSTVPTSERQARPLTALKTPEARAEAWTRAVDTLPPGQPMTAAHVTRAVQPLVEKPSVSDARQTASTVLAPATSRATFNRTNANVDWAWWTWNPVTGCLHGCPYCYARELAHRFYPQKFEPTFHADRLAAPANTAVPKSDDPRSRRVFTCSMADLFGKWVPQPWIDAVFEQVRDNPQWQFLFLTKFPQRLAELEWPDNAWVGTSVDQQHRVAIAEKAFRGVTAGVKWLSVEPMLEPLRFTSLEMFDWVVIGAQSATNQPDGTHVPAFMPELDWVTDLLKQAADAGCEVFIKDNLLPLIRREPRVRGRNLPHVAEA